MLNLLYRVVSFNPVRTLTFNRSLPVEDPEPQIPILDQWHQAALTSVPQFKREVDLLWGRTVTSVLGASPIDEDRQHFQALLEPLLKPLLEPLLPQELEVPEPQEPEAPVSRLSFRGFPPRPPRCGADRERSRPRLPLPPEPAAMAETAMGVTKWRSRMAWSPMRP